VGAEVSRTKWDLLTLSLAGMMLTYVWRFQDLVLVLRPLQAVTLFSLAAVLFLVLSRDSRRRLSGLSHPVALLVIALTVHLFVGVPFSLYPGSVLGFLRGDHVKTIALCLMIAVGVRTFADVERLAAVLVAGFAIAALARLLTDWSSGMYDPNDDAFVAICTLPLVFYFVQRSTSWLAKAAFLGIVAVGIYVVIGSASRGGFLGLGAVLFYTLLRFRTLPVKVRVGAVSVLMLGAVLVGSDAYWARIATILRPQDDYNWTGAADTGRMEIWKRGIGYMLQRPVMGVGAKNFNVAEGVLSEQGRLQQFGEGFRWSAAHNSFVQIGAEAGMVGLVLFAGIFFFAFRGLRRASVAARRGQLHLSEGAMAEALAGCLVGYGVSGFFLSQGYSALLYVILGLIVGFLKVLPARTSRYGRPVPRSQPASRLLHPSLRPG